jgi:sirohydrochlorin cobaltochelatase
VSKTALVLAAHGSRIELSTNENLAEMAGELAGGELFDEVTPAFHHGQPRFAEVLDKLDATEAIVVPVMTSEGYFCDEVLPRELRRNRRFPDIIVRQTAPVGTHPDMSALIHSRAHGLMRQFGLQAPDTCVAVVGHGTPRNARSRDATVRLAEELAAIGPFAEVRYAFLDEDPGVETLLHNNTTLLVVPFLISGGPHATVDIPARLAMSCVGEVPPFHEQINGRTMICDRAIGLDRGIVDLILDLAVQAQSESAARRSEFGTRSTMV